MKRLLRFFDRIGVIGRVRNGWIITSVPDDSDCTALTAVWNFEQQIVVIIATGGIVPSNQVLIKVVNIAANVWERVTTKLKLRNVREYFGIGAKINVLRVSFRLHIQTTEVRKARKAQLVHSISTNIPDIRR
jgi:hypothetical protein